MILRFHHLIIIEDSEESIHFLVEHSFSDHEMVEERQLQDLFELLDRESKTLGDIIEGLPDVNHKFRREVHDALTGRRHRASTNSLPHERTSLLAEDGDRFAMEQLVG